MSDDVRRPVVVLGVVPGDPPFRPVQAGGETLGVAHDMMDVIRLARQVGWKHVDLDDPAQVRWVGGGKYKWRL
ncbi:hypothetical protein [Streptomyces sp. NPDC093600]|uniref:hypothetical protein n=1 Tax=Streptomyces sp. NPDC093600 TaxID=3366047 RepID=UPI00382410F8